MGPNSGEIIIDDGNYSSFINPVVDGEVKFCSAQPRDYGACPHGSRDFASPFDLPIIPRSEWSARIKEMEETKSRLSDLWFQEKVDILDQNGTNYCWTNGVVSCMLIVRALNNQPYVKLSPASVAAPIKNFSNQGGWGGEALEWIVKNGITTVDIWPANAINRSYYTDAEKADAATRKITEWYDLTPRSFEQQMTLALLRIPVAIGLNWWSHEVCQLDPVEISPNNFGIRIANSWGANWSDRGMGILTESKARADDAVAPRVVSVTQK